MKKIFAEETVLFMSLIKWFILSAIIGTIVGVSTTVFLKLLSWGIGVSESYGRYFFLLPITLFISALVIKLCAPEAKGQGTERVLESIHKRSGRIDIKVVPVKLFATVITIASGGSAGKWGPAAQIGSGLASTFSNLIKANDAERRRLAICGISAGFASVFATPIAGAIFGLEVLVAGRIAHEDLFPAFVAGIFSYQVASFLGVDHFSVSIALTEGFSSYLFILVIIAGIFFGLCSLFLIELLEYVQKLADKIKIWEPWKGIFGGLLLIVLTLLFTTKYLGLGENVVHSVLQGSGIVWYAFILKAVFTSITLSFGGSGGLISPILFVGTTAGAAFAQLFNYDISIFAAIGMVSLLAGATNTPIASSIMAVELFGSSIAPYAALACVISFLMTGHRCVFPSQILGIRKSMSLDTDIGSDMEKIKTSVRFHKNSFSGYLMSLLAKIWKEEDDNDNS